jgi:hypothetical protein
MCISGEIVRRDAGLPQDSPARDLDPLHWHVFIVKKAADVRPV